MGRCAFGDGFCKQPAQERAIHLHHVRKIQIQHVPNCLLHPRMISPNVKNAVPAQKIEIRLIIHIIEVRAFRARIHLVEPDHALRRHQRRIHMAFMELIIFAQSRRDNLFQVKSHQVQKLPRFAFETQICSGLRCSPRRRYARSRLQRL